MNATATPATIAARAAVGAVVVHAVQQGKTRAVVAEVAVAVAAVSERASVTTIPAF